MERNKTKEQLEEEKKISLSFRIKPLAIEGFGEQKLREKAQELWELIVKLETEKYDLEERQKRQDYDVSKPPPPILNIQYISKHITHFACSWKSWRKDRSNSSGTKPWRRVSTQKLWLANTR